MNEALMKAILSMDSYNRGYDAGINLTGSSIGNAIIDSDSASLGTITVGGQTVPKDENIGFYAAAYNYNGQIIISYRGTDAVGKDLLHAWGTGGGDPSTGQAKMAFDFYRLVAGSTDPRFADIELTGHSQGGGLAGLVGAAYGKNGILFDNMAFTEAVSEIPDYIDFDPLQTFDDYDPDLQATIYGTTTPWAAYSGGLLGIYMDGEALSSPYVPGNHTNQGITETAYGLGYSGYQSDFGGIQLHSIASLVMAMYAEGLTSQAWESAAEYFWPVLYDGAFASQIGTASVSGALLDEAVGNPSNPNDGDITKYADILRMAIAYSTVDEGTRPFGDTGIKALYDDANQFGTLLSQAGASSNLTEYAEEISQSYVQYAAQLALKQVLQSDTTNNPNAIDGALSVSGNMLIIDFNETKWKAGGSTLPYMIARDEIADNLIYETGLESEISSSMDELWGSDSASKFERVILATIDASATHSLATPTSSKANLFLGGSSGSTINGSAGDDMVIGGAGADIIQAKQGENILVGMDGNDNYLLSAAYSSANSIIELAGTDTLNVSGISPQKVSYLNQFAQLVTVDQDRIYLSVDNDIFHVGVNRFNTSIQQYTGVMSVDLSASAISNGTGVENIVFNGFSYTAANLLSLASSGPMYKSVYQLSQDADWNYNWSYGSGGYGAGGGVITSYDENGNLQGIVVNPSSYGSSTAYLAQHATTIFHPWVVTSFSAGGGSAVINYDTYQKEIIFNEEYDAGDIRFTATHEQGNASLNIHLDSVGALFTLAWFETGKYIEGYGIYDKDFHSLIQDSETTGLVDYGGGRFNGSYSGGISNHSVGSLLQSITYYFEKISFASGGSIDMQGMLTFKGTSSSETLYGLDTRGDTIMGLDGSDTILGYGDADTLIGGEGNDQLYGGTGNDVYQFNLGDGQDNVTESGGTDEIRFGAGITLADLRFEHTYISNMNNLLIYVGTGTDTVHLYYQFYDLQNGTNSNDEVETLRFADNSTFSLLGGLTFTGTSGSEQVHGTKGNDTIVGSVGNDQLFGQQGNDIYRFDIGDGQDTVTDMAGNDEIRFGAGITLADLRFEHSYISNMNNLLIYVGSGTDTIHLYYQFYDLQNSTSSYDEIETLRFADNSTFNLSGSLTFKGTSGSEQVHGTKGNDTIVGSTGNDQLFGQQGNDTYQFDLGDGQDTVTDTAGTDEIRFGAGITLADLRFEHTYTTNMNNLLIYVGSGTDTIHLYYQFYDLQNGTSSYDEIELLRFSDNSTFSLSGSLTFKGTSGSEQVHGTKGNDTIIGSAGNDQLFGQQGNDVYRFDIGDGQDTVTDTAGTDEIHFGAGITLADLRFEHTYTSSMNNLLIYVGSGNDTIQLNYQFYDRHNGTSSYDEIETLRFADNSTFSLSGNFTFKGTSAAEYIYGTKGNDILVGLAGNDSLFGDVGTDTADYTSATSAVTANLTAGSASNDGYGNTDYFTSIENLTGSQYADTLTGDGAANTIYGGAGNDNIDAGAGNDIVSGGLGNDTLVGGSNTDTLTYFDATAGVTVSIATVTAQNTIGAGTDTISGFENLTGSSFDDNLTGDANANVIEGGDGNDTIEGGAGSDTLNGGSGSGDTLKYSNAASAITLSLALTSAQVTGGAGTDTVSNFENIIGSAYNDVLTGSSGDNIIEGGLGNDTMNGGAGTGDTLRYASATSAITISLAIATAQATGGAGSDTVSNFENIIGSAYNDVLTGSSGDNIIEGGLGNDTLNGGAGTGDTVSYSSATAAVTVNLATTTSQNTVAAGSDTITNFENLTGSAFNDTLTGNTGANVISGGAGNDSISGGDGNDTLIGGLGNDTLNGGNGTDTASYATSATAVTVNMTAGTVSGEGSDTLSAIENITGSGFADTLTGNSSANTLNGGDGNDTLNGGGGVDTVNGGNGSDILIFSDGVDTLYGGADSDLFWFAASNTNSDTIADFSLAQLDKIDISDLLVGYNPLTSAITDFVQITTSGSNSLLSVDTNGGANSFVQVATITGVTGLTDEAALVASGNLVVT